MKQTVLTVEYNETIAKNTYEMRLRGDLDGINRPGQFVNLALDGFYLRRPISVCDLQDGILTLIYKTVGAGTESMTGLKKGAALDTLTGLGNGFDTSLSGDRPLVIGGGMGAAPVFWLAKTLQKEGKKPVVVLGFNEKDEIFLADRLEALGIEVRIATLDGSVGVKGFVTDAIREVKDSTYYYTCGPLPMMKAVWQSVTCGGQLSLEERMGCGFGACMGCSIETNAGFKRVCKDGPVFRKEELLW